MIKLLIFGLIGFFGLIILAMKRKREEKLQKELSELAMSKDEKVKGDGEILDILYRSFLFAKGSYFKIEDAYSRENPKQYLLDISYSSQGNMDITFQRLVFILETVPDLNHSFVVENTTSNSKTLAEDLEIAGFLTRNYFKDQLTWVKSTSQNEFRRNFETFIKPLVKLYPDICVELHSNKLLIYQNQTGLSLKKISLFYNQIVKEFLPALKKR